MPSQRGRKIVLTRCNEIGLHDKEIELLKDLLGWNYNDTKKIPNVYRGIELNLTARAINECLESMGEAMKIKDILTEKIACVLEMPSFAKDLKMCISIQNLIHKIIGRKLMLSVYIDPVKTFKEDFGLDHYPAVWLIAQLHLVEASNFFDEFTSIISMPLGIVANQIVMPTLCKLLKLPPNLKK